MQEIPAALTPWLIWNIFGEKEKLQWLYDFELARTLWLEFQCWLLFTFVVTHWL